MMWWTVSTVWWVLSAITSALSYRGMVEGSWTRVLTVGVAGSLLWIPTTVIVLWMAERYPIDRQSWRVSVPIVLVGAVVTVVMKAVYVTVTNPWVKWYDELPPFSDVLLRSVSNNFFLFWLVVGVAHAMVYGRHIAEREEQLARAELQHLKAQLHPHFLFNALNTVNSFVRTDPEIATQMITRLSTLLRHALQRESAQEVTLREELEILGAYVDIEQVRFDERLRVIWRIDPEVMEVQVPHLLLQPLVENAIRHGIAPTSVGGTVEIAASRRIGSVHLSVKDDGIGWDIGAVPTHGNGATAGHGVGLANTRLRLQQLYGGAQAMRVASVAPHGLCVEIDLPFRELAAS
jgi:two-component system, LytTR family, sensor kinase